MRVGAAAETLKGRGEPREAGVGPLMVSRSGERVKYGGSFIMHFEFCLNFMRKFVRSRSSIGGVKGMENARAGD